MRYFPGAPRPRHAHSRALALALSGVVALGAVAIPLAHADDDDDLEDRQKSVQGRIDSVSDDLVEASSTATRAARAYDVAHARLGRARDHLDDVLASLVEARERDARLQEELTEAENELVVADAALASGQAAVTEQRIVVRDSALQVYAQGDPQLRALGALLDNASLKDLSTQQVAESMIVGRGAQAYEGLSDAEEDLTDQQRIVGAATERVAAKREEAAAHLETMRGLYEEARVAKVQVEDRVGASRSAKKASLQARQADRDKLRALKQREAAIKQRLVALAKAAKARQAKQGGGFTGVPDGFLSYPTNGPVTSPYGYRVHPIYGYYSLHDGTDFGVSCGQALYAAAAGTVIDTYYDSVYGNRLFLNVGVVNGQSLVLIYNHMSGYAAHEGDRVGRGEVVGYAGTTGWSTGCHLHFTVMGNGTAVDPMGYL